jgi:hypothetical protein
MTTFQVTIYMDAENIHGGVQSTPPPASNRSHPAIARASCIRSSAAGLRRAAGAGHVR